MKGYDMKINEILKNKKNKMVAVTNGKIEVFPYMLYDNIIKKGLLNGVVYYTCARYLSRDNVTTIFDDIIVDSEGNVYDIDNMVKRSISGSGTNYKTVYLPTIGSKVIHRLSNTSFRFSQVSGFTDKTKVIEVDHIDGDISNNKLINLQWKTPSENVQLAKLNNPDMHKRVAVLVNGKLFYNRTEAFKYIGAKFGIHYKVVRNEVSYNMKEGDQYTFRGYTISILNKKALLALHPDIAILEKPYDNYGIKSDGFLYEVYTGTKFSAKPYNDGKKFYSKGLCLEMLVSKYLMMWNGVDIIVHKDGDLGNNAVSNLKLVPPDLYYKENYGEGKLTHHIPGTAWCSLNIKGEVISTKLDQLLTLSVPDSTKHGYVVAVREGGGNINVYPHKEMYRLFKKLNPDHYVITHKDGNVKNNSIENLIHDDEFIFNYDIVTTGNIKYYAVVKGEIVILRDDLPIDELIKDYGRVFAKLLAKGSKYIITTDGRIYNCSTCMYTYIYGPKSNIVTRITIDGKGTSVSLNVLLKSAFNKEFNLKSSEEHIRRRREYTLRVKNIKNLKQI